jgi:hypothetical protein
MARYLIIESRDPFGGDAATSYELAASLAREGNQVTLLLVQNGVFPARRCRSSSLVEACARAGVRVIADEFSLRERGITRARMSPEVEAAPIDCAIDELERGAKALWH